MSDANDLAEVYALRCACWQAGYRPLAVYSPGAMFRGTPIKGAGKAPVGKDWLKRALQDPPEAVSSSRLTSPLALNTGIVTGEVSGIDIDVLIPDVVDELIELVKRTLGRTPLARIGNAPKILACYRSLEPFTKLATQNYQMPDGSKGKLEILGSGQQFVAFGIHPDTKRPYRWIGQSPLEVPLAELPSITLMQARDLIGDAETIIEAGGGVIIKPPQPPKKDPPPKPAAGLNGSTENFFRAVNNAALDNIPAWAQELHPDFRDRGHSGWRLSSKDLGRDLEEDIAIHSTGIRDFGEEVTLTAIDLAIKLGPPADALAAAFWLCDLLGQEPAKLGWHGRAPSGNGLDPDAGNRGGGGIGELPPPPDELDGADDIPDPDDTPDTADEELTPEKLEQMREQIRLRNARILAWLQSTYSIVCEAGKTIVVRWRPDEILKRDVLDRITFADFNKMYQNRSIEDLREKKNKKNGVQVEVVLRNLAEWYLSHHERTQYLSGIIFSPHTQAPTSYMNLWRGFSIEPQPGDWSLLKDHLLRVVCAGNTEHYDYFLNLAARMFQYPQRQGEVATVLRGPKGAGKGTVLLPLVAAWGQHGLHITAAKHLIGHFNDHLRDCVALFADEAFFAGDKQHEGILKGLITEDTIAIERKRFDVIQVANMLHIWMSSDSDWVVPATVDERRFFVLNVADNQVGNWDYFNAIQTQMRTTGLAAMIHELLNRNIADFNFRQIPQTAALKTQKALSLPSLERWWLSVLSRGFIWKSRHGTPWFGEWHDFYTTELLSQSYLQWCDENRPYDRKNRVQLGTFLHSLYSWSRPSVEHPVYEIDSIDRSKTHDVHNSADSLLQPGRSLDDIAIVKKTDQPGYRVETIDEARCNFLNKYDITPVPWRDEVPLP